MPTLVLLGAGASFGSEQNGVARPPLGDELFNELEKLGGIASKIPDHLKLIFRDAGFESGMAAFYNELGVHFQEFQRELAGYISSFYPTADSQYLNLIRLFSPRKTIFASLNYDLLLEQAAELLNFSYKYDDVRLHGALRIIKPHGSSNFWPDIPMENFNGVVFVGCNTDVIAPVIPLTRAQTIYRCKLDNSLSPVMSMYAKGKQVKNCPDYVSSQQVLFDKACRFASKIFIFGVKVVQEDSHIWRPLANTGAKITYFGSQEDKLNLEAWMLESGKKNVDFIGKYFDGALRHIADNNLHV